MEKKSGVDENGRSLPTGGGAVRATGDTFQPNLAMGGGSYKVPVELPQGPGGFAPKLDLLYNTGFGGGPFGLGWAVSVPFVERRRASPYAPPGEVEYTVSGAEALVPQGGGRFVPFVQQALQTFAFDGAAWTSVATNLVEMRFGSTAASRVSGVVDGSERVCRWLLDRVTFPGDRHVEFEYLADGPQRYLRQVSWSVFRLVFVYEERPDPFSQYDTGFELRVTRRCRRIELHQTRLAPETLMRTYTLGYEPAESVGTSMLRSLQVSGWRFEQGELRETALPPMTFGYTAFDPSARRIEKFTTNTIPPPALGDDATLLDYRGTSLPGVLRMNGVEATFWENRGNLRWGPPQRLAALPQGIRLSEDRVRFADMNGNGTADLVVADSGGGGFYPNDPELGFTRKETVRLAPDFDLGEEGSWLLDLDGDRVIDLLTFRNGSPVAFLNRPGRGWSAPFVLPSENLPNFNRRQPRMRFADMNGDGNPDLVMLNSRRVVYYPSLGNGRWAAPRVMDATPEFDVPNPDEDVYLADVDGDGTADLVLVGNGVVRVYLNRGGESFAPPIELRRAPRLGVEQFLLTDMTGSGTAGFLWTHEGTAAVPHQYWFLDLLNGVKPYLLRTIDNGCGLVTEIEYGTSTRERVADLEGGARWSGYLPFVVHVVKRLSTNDLVTGINTSTEYRYHDGHYDGRAREYLGFARVDSLRAANANEDAVLQRYYFHNRGTSAADPAFIAGKGQPHRTELLDSSTGELRQVEEATWEARAVPTADPERPAYLALETARTSRRIQGGAVYEQERIEYEHDAVGNVTRESRRGEWTDTAGAARLDRLVIETSYASHPVHGLTSFASRVRRKDGAGRLVKHFSFFYDGPAFAGLPLGQVERGWRTRQTEIALTTAEIDEAYGGVAPPLLATLYRAEVDAEHGPVFVKDTRRYRFDAFGNQVETLDAVGHAVVVSYDAEGIHPVGVSEDGGPVRQMTYDPLAQQVAAVEDLNGHVVETTYDGLGNVLTVSKRGALPGLPTETYEHRRDVIPNVVVQRVRLRPEDAEPGWEKRDYLDGSGQVCQRRKLSEDGRWAVAKQEFRSPAGHVLREHDAYFSAAPDFDAAPPAGLATREMFYDFAGRVSRERLYNGATIRYVYAGNAARFYGPEDSDALDADPAAPPTRVSRTDAWSRVVSIEERDAAGTYEQRREYDADDRLARLLDSMNHVVLENSYDLWGNRIRILSAEAGVTTFVFDAALNEVLRTDADGRAVFRAYDLRGRVTEVRTGGPLGPVEETYTYDAGAGDNVRGRLAGVSGAFGTAEYSYSPEGDPVRIRRTFVGNPDAFEIRFGYDNQRQVTFVEYPDGARVDYQYHPNGMLASIPGYVDAIEYGPTGERVRVAFANGLETLRTYTPGDYLLSELLTRRVSDGVKYQHLVYDLDRVGQVARIEDLSTVTGKLRNDQTFTYDRRNRLVRATGRGADGPYDFEYRYDELSNLTFSGESFAEEMLYGHHAGDAAHPNRLVRRQAAAGAEYEYDASGNLTRDPALGTLEYDARHRLVRVTRPDGAVVSYAYDHNDRRTASRVEKDGETTARYEVEGVYLVEQGGPVKIVFDKNVRLAIVPNAGDALLHHLDRLGSVNVVSNLATGAFVGHDEYTPYGRLSVSLLIMPHFSFRGARFADGLDITLLGARHYRPALGRFLTPDSYLILNPHKMPGLLSAANLYIYAYSNPAVFTDPTGQIAPLLVALIVAAIVGAVLGAIGAAVNGVDNFGEFLLWVIGGMIGAVLVTLAGAGIGLLVGASAGAALLGAQIALTIWGVASLLGTMLTPILDDSDSGVAWFFSFLLKWIQSPITTTIGLIAALVVAIGGGEVDFRRGALFIEASGGGGALTLGAVVWTGKNEFVDGKIPDDLARHESQHTRTVVALGELGFYLTYITVGAIWGVAEGGCWNDLNAAGEGNPFEKSAHTFTSSRPVACT